jgi:hypothetical protein
VNILGATALSSIPELHLTILHISPDRWTVMQHGEQTTAPSSCSLPSINDRSPKHSPRALIAT